jgi:hypothetical protein
MSLTANTALTPFASIIEDLSPYGFLLEICGQYYRVQNDDDDIFLALTLSLGWKKHEVTFARINSLRHWLQMANKHNVPFLDNLPLTLPDVKDFINKTICFVYPVSDDESINAKRNKNLEFITELFSIQFNNYTIGG